MDIITQLPNTETRYEGIAAPTHTAVDHLAGTSTHFMLDMAIELSRLIDLAGDLWADAAQVTREYGCYDTEEEWAEAVESVSDEARSVEQTIAFLSGLAARTMGFPLAKGLPTPSEITWAFEDCEPF